MLQADSALYRAKKDKGATKLWAHKYFRIERSGDEGKASRPDQKHFAPNGQ
uniref:Uncharacterized protein n=1 Tax=Klebsiella pneumoniae TaxID=573 RepID=A0A8B0SVU1_KLEPN|nr:hypothetical protein [Klebsiella pneumoniae]